ncbi:MAG: putative bifunctional diguanylate cyclase/phosphodiesterase [Alsobacter sp.]
MRQHAQIVLSMVVAGLLAVLVAGGTLTVRQADQQATDASPRIAADLFEQWRAEAKVALLGFLREHVDGQSGAPAVSAPRGMSAALTVAGRVTIFPAATGQAIPGETAVLGRAAARIKADLAAGRPPASFVVEFKGDQGNLILVEPVRRAEATGHVIAVAPISIAALAPRFERTGLNDLGIVAGSVAEDQPFLRIGATEDGIPVVLAWSRISTATEIWQSLIPLMVVAILGMAAAILLSVRFARRAGQMVGEIETQAFDRATRDPLTGLHNRSGFKIRLDQALERRLPDAVVGVLYLDLDRFKEVNDGFGHEAGDALLVAVTERLRRICGTNVLISRLGGDEFAVVVERRVDPASVVALGDAISRELALPFVLGSIEAVIGGSIGIAIAPDDGDESTGLVRRADISMYRAKTAGRGLAMRFDPSMEDEIRRRKMMEAELRRAIDRNQLAVHYQPFLASDGETVVGVEALLRWKHPTEGMIPPSFFIKLAEETGQIGEIGDWVMRKSLEDAKRWPSLKLSINVSPVQFRSRDLVEKIVAMVREAEIDPHRVEIEITEGVLMEDAELAITIITALRKAGMHMALDDFGTGYASLSYLRRFPFDKLKVDQAFVRNLGVTAGAAAIIHSVVSLGRSLGMTVHAEGVETLEQHIFLRASGCHDFQGYYFARPMPADELDIYLTRHSVAVPRFGMRA